MAGSFASDSSKRLSEIEIVYKVRGQGITEKALEPAICVSGFRPQPDPRDPGHK